MADRQKIVRVFIGSPGGLQEERQAAHDVVNSINRSHSDRWGLQFKLLGWEDAVPGYVRPQSKINEDLDRCDYFIGVLWNHWGSRPSSGSDGFTSGFEEEYYRAAERIEKGLMKDMAVYFKEVSIPQGFEPADSLKKVLDLRKKFVEEKKIFFKDFSNISSFRDVVREKLEEIGWRETDLFLEQADVTQSERGPAKPDQANDKPHPDVWLLDEAARAFLNDLTNRALDWDETSPQDVARLRLIGTSVTRHGNDEAYLGNHDANLMFQRFRNEPLSRQEIRALTDCGIIGSNHQNVPLWRWLARSYNGNAWERVEFLAMLGNESQKASAILILALAARPIPHIKDLLDKRRVLRGWLLDEDTPSAVFEAAVTYISSKVTEEDLSLIEQVASACSAEKQEKIEEGIVRLLSRTTTSGALNRVMDKNLAKIDSGLADHLFSNPNSLATETLVGCLAAKAESVRLRATRLLSQRGELSVGSAETLLTDSNHEIRLLAAETLKNKVAIFDDEIAKKALRILKPSTGLGGLFARAAETDDSYYNRYKMNRLLELDYTSLKAKADAAGVLDDDALKALYSKFARKAAPDMRRNLANRFKDYFSQKLEFSKDAGFIDSEAEKKLKSLETFVRKDLCNAALTSLCSLKHARDLPLVRDVLRDMEIDATPSILTYLGRFGEWSDVGLIKKLGEYGRIGISLLGAGLTTLPDEKASAIFRLGRERLADLLSIDIDSRIRLAIAKVIPSGLISQLEDDLILRELDRKEDKYRVIFALKCILALPRSRVLKLLDRYVDSGEHRFYNSVHWLDLGVSFPVREARGIAERALSRHQ